MDPEAYPLICIKCGKGRDYGFLDYLGEGKFQHIECSSLRAYKLRKVKNIQPEATVPQCTYVGHLDGSCPYFETEAARV